MAIIDVEVDISEFSDKELLNEMCRRLQLTNFSQEDREKLKRSLGITKSGMIHGETLDVVLKKEVLEHAINKYTLPELEKRLA